jgi:hypothetical protein
VARAACAAVRSACVVVTVSCAVIRAVCSVARVAWALVNVVWALAFHLSFFYLLINNGRFYDLMGGPTTNVPIKCIPFMFLSCRAKNLPKDKVGYRPTAICKQCQYTTAVMDKSGSKANL